MWLRRYITEIVPVNDLKVAGVAVRLRVSVTVHSARCKNIAERLSNVRECVSWKIAAIKGGIEA